jgi:flagellar export protein FliJ
MTTPYDAAMRVIRREVDDMRLVIGEAAQRLVELEQVRHALGASLRREARVADAMVDATLVPTDRYFTQLRAHQTAAGSAIRDADAGLAALRRQAGERYARLKTIETAAEDYRAAHATALATAEQGHADDIAALRFLRLRAATSRAGRATRS